MLRTGDEHARARRHRRDRCSAPVEDDDVGFERAGELGTGENVRLEHLPREPGTGASAADGHDTGNGGRLEMIGCGVPSRTRQREQLVERPRPLDQLRLGRPAAAHRHDDDVVIAREQPRDVARDGGLAYALARPDHGQRREVERREPRWIETEVRAHVRQPERERAAHEPQALARREHRLVGEVDDDVCRNGGERVDERHPVILAAAQLFRTPHEQRADELVRQGGKCVAHHGRVVLPVDHGQRTRHVGRTSPSIRAVYFSNSRVSVENWMIFSCPWYGYLRHTSTCPSAISIRL